jgi:hypothetical protein
MLGRTTLSGKRSPVYGDRDYRSAPARAGGNSPPEAAPAQLSDFRSSNLRELTQTRTEFVERGTERLRIIATFAINELTRVVHELDSLHTHAHAHTPAVTVSPRPAQFGFVSRSTRPSVFNRSSTPPPAVQSVKTPPSVKSSRAGSSRMDDDEMEALLNSMERRESPVRRESVFKTPSPVRSPRESIFKTPSPVRSPRESISPRRSTRTLASSPKPSIFKSQQL